MAVVLKNMMVFSGTSNRPLAEEIAQQMGVELGNVKITKFANGEIYARYLESVRGADVFIIQSVSGAVNDALMELLIMTDAAKRASARTVTAVITHYGYSRQDKKSAAREPITAKLVANLYEVAGVDRIIAMDLHQGQIQGFFDIPVNHLTALPIFAGPSPTRVSRTSASSLPTSAAPKPPRSSPTSSEPTSRSCTRVVPPITWPRSPRSSAMSRARTAS